MAEEGRNEQRQSVPPTDAEAAGAERARRWLYGLTALGIALPFILLYFFR